MAPVLEATIPDQQADAVISAGSAGSTGSVSGTGASGSSRRSRVLSPRQQRVKTWVSDNYGVLSYVARECGVSAEFVYFVAYGIGDRRSKDLRVERTLKALGCPLIQKIQ